MGKKHLEIDESIAKFIQEQHVFFVATAPLGAQGHINLSPKGLDSLRILGPRTIAYVDLIGSGVETIAHVKENGRILVMFCAFQGTPKILRLHGQGRVVEPQEGEFASLAQNFPEYDGTRSIILVEVTRIAESCGYAVPLMQYKGQRAQYFAWAQHKGPGGLKTYRLERNHRSIDGLPGLAD